MASHQTGTATVTHRGCDMKPVLIVDTTPTQLDWLITLAELNRAEAQGEHVKEWLKLEILSGTRADPYRVSGIGRDEFDPEDKDKIRRYVRLLHAHRDVARAHAYAAGRPGRWSREII